MVSDSWSRRTALARCWRTSCYGLLYLLCTALVFIMMWLLWCYVGLVALPGSEPQRRAIVHYSATTSKPNLTTLLANSTTPTPRPSSKDLRPPQRGSSRGEAPLVKEAATHAESSSNSKGDSGLRDRGNKTPLNISADILSKGPSSDTSLKPKRFDDQPSVDEISVRAVSSSAPENRDDLTGSAPRDFDKDADKGRRIPELLPSRDDERPVDRPRYDDDTRARDYDRGRSPSRDYADPELRVRDDEISPTRTDDRLRRVDSVRPYDDRDRPRSDRDRDDYPRRRYDDIDDREYSRPSRKREDDLDYRPPVRRVDDDYDRERRPLARDDRYIEPLDDRPKSDRRYEDADRRRPPEYYKDRIEDDKITEDRYRSRADDRYRGDRGDRYRPTDDDYRKDRFQDEDRYRGKPVDDDGYRRDGYRSEDRIRSQDDRYDDRLRPRPVDEVYRPKTAIDAVSRREDIRPRAEPSIYRDEIEPRRSRDDGISSSSVYNSRVRDSLERSDDSRTYARDSVPDSPTSLKSSMDDDRRRDRKDERRILETDVAYESRSRAPISSERDRPRIRDEPRYDDDYRRRPVIDDDRYPERRLDDERPRPVRTDEDYRGSSPRLSKGDDRGAVRDRPVYIEEDRELSGRVRARPEDVTLDRRSYANDDDYKRNRPRIDPKLSYDRDDPDSRYRPPPRRSPDTDYRDDRYEGRPKDRYDSDDYDRKDDRRYSRVDPRDDSYDRARDSIRPSRPVIDERPIRPSLEDLPPRDTYARNPRPAIDDIPARDELPYSRDRDIRARDYPRSESPRPPQTNIREKRYQESDEPLRDSSSSRFSKDEPRRALTPKEVIEAAYRQRDEPDRPVETVYPVFDPRVNNMTSPDVVRPNERRGTTILSRRRKK